MADDHVHQPVRSISLPCRLHPTSAKLEAAINHLKAWKTYLDAHNVCGGSNHGLSLKTCKTEKKTAVFSGETIQFGLVGLAELQNCVHEMISSPETQRAFVHHQNGRLVEAALDESVVFLDTCDKGRDILLMIKEHVQTLQSALRRKRGDLSIEAEVSAYISFRKKVRKEVAKCIGALKKTESKFDGSSTEDDVMAVKLPREASSITFSVFRSLMLFLSLQASTKSNRGWSKISKLVSRRLLFSSDKELQKVTFNEIESVDLAVHSTIDGKFVEAEMVQRMLKTLEASVNGLEAGLDCIFKCLVRNTVTLLDIITNH